MKDKEWSWGSKWKITSTIKPCSTGLYSDSNGIPPVASISSTRTRCRLTSPQERATQHPIKTGEMHTHGDQPPKEEGKKGKQDLKSLERQGLWDFYQKR